MDVILAEPPYPVRPRLEADALYNENQLQKRGKRMVKRNQEATQSAVHLILCTSWQNLNKGDKERRHTRLQGDYRYGPQKLMTKSSAEF